MGTTYILVNHSTEEYIQSKHVLGWNGKQSEWEHNNSSREIMALALSRWAGLYVQSICWESLDDDKTYKLMEKYEDITLDLIKDYNSDYVQKKRTRYHLPYFWLKSIIKLDNGKIIFWDNLGKVVIHRKQPPKNKPVEETTG